MEFEAATIFKFKPKYGIATSLYIVFYFKREGSYLAGCILKNFF